jgi:hypothetical protein
MSTTVASRKAKARNLQNTVRDRILSLTGLPTEDVVSAPMGVTGADIKLSTAAQEAFPFAVECKNAESISIWKAWEQAEGHTWGTILDPMLVIKRNRSPVLAVVTFNRIMLMQDMINALRKELARVTTDNRE